MFLYFNNQGELTTCIPHGEIPRQGNPLNVYVALNRKFFENKDPNTLNGWKIKVSIIYSDNNMTEGFPMDYLGLQKFKKNSDSEIIYDLVEGGTYHTFWQKIPAEYSTVEFGDKKLLVTFYKRKKLNDGSYSDEQVEYYNQEVCVIHVEKTYGSAVNPGIISKNQYNILKKSIDACLANSQQAVTVNNNTVGRLEEIFNFVSSGNSAVIFYNGVYMQVLSVKNFEGNKSLICFYNNGFYSFSFNENDDINLKVYPQKININL